MNGIKILMRHTIVGAYPELNVKRKARFRARENEASRAGLNFKFEKYYVQPHGIKRYLKGHHYITGAHGLCAVCGREAQVCTCKIIIQDASSGKVVGEL